MIELTAQGGEPVAVNPNALWHVRPANADQTAIYSTSGAVLFVAEGYAQVLALLQAHASPTTSGR